MKAYRMPQLCCPNPLPAPSTGKRQLLQQSGPAIAECPFATPMLPTLGQCQYTTGMVVLCSVSNVYYLINNTLALPFSPAAYQSAGSPLPSFVTKQCCSTVINGCGVPYTASALGSTFSTAPMSSILPGGPAIQWNTLYAPNSLSGLLQGSSYASGGSILSSVNGQFFLQVGPGTRFWAEKRADKGKVHSDKSTGFGQLPTFDWFNLVMGNF